MQEKLLLFILKMANACNYKVFSSSLWLFSDSLLIYYSSSTTYKMRYENLFYLRGLFELFPPTYLPYSITLNGLSSPESDLDLSHTNINGRSYLQPAQRHGFPAQQLKH
jgi:hypothetical protein